MIKRIQDISFKVSRYFRPLETWHCGGMEDGNQCLLGPDKNGNCRAVDDCKPDLEGKTWTCARSEILGGKCSVGPTNHGACGKQRPPCQPVKSVRARRSRFAWVVAFGALALGSLMLTMDNWNRSINPGQLSKHHAAFGSTDCGACHTSATMPRSSWLQRAMAGGDDVHQGAGDVSKCTSCHLLGEESESVHSLSAANLSALTEAANSGEAVASNASLLVKVAQGFQSNSGEAPACSVCHDEHKGSNADITQVSNQQCAVCHTQSFDDFAGHSDFKNYPAQKRTPIIFSHNSHLNKHFAEEDLAAIAPQACGDCHKTDSIGRKMVLTGFETSCAGCHGDQVTGESRAGDKGFAMMTVPGLDVETLTERGVDIGEWPDYSDAEMTSLNLLVVSALNPDIAGRLDEFREIDLYDLRDASDEQFELVYDVIWTLKRAYFMLQRGGARSLSKKIDALLPGEASRQVDIFGLLPPAVIQQATDDAFPNLEAEMTDWISAGRPEFTVTAVAAPEPEPEAPAQPATSSGDDDDWLAGAVDDSGEDDDWLAGAVDEDGDEGDDWLAGAVDDEADAGDDDWLSAAADESADDGDDWLSEAAGSDDADGSDDAAGSDDAGDDWLAGALDDEGGDDDWLEDASSASLDDDAIEVEDLEEETAPTAELPELLSLEDRAAAGGWYYENYVLRYRPSGHADRLIVAWVDRLLGASRDGLIDVSLEQGLQRAFLGESTPGSCLKCHSMDGNQAGQVTQINWRGFNTDPNTHDFNAFRHQSHFSMVDGAADDFGGDEMGGCRSCHVINPDSDSASGYESIVLADFQSDFHDLDKGRCSDCHTEKQALTNCTLCHNYHIGDRGLSGIQATKMSPAKDSVTALSSLSEELKEGSAVDNGEQGEQAEGGSGSE